MRRWPQHFRVDAKDSSKSYEPCEVRLIIVGEYEARYEIAAETVFILRLWSCRDKRSFESVQ